MKKPVFRLALAQLAALALLLLPKLASAQEYREKFRELDAMLAQPFGSDIISGSSFARLLYKKQVSTTGLSVAEGRTLGTNLTVGDEALALNIGVVVPGTKTHFALIGNGRFTPEQGYAKLLTSAAPLTNYAIGGTLHVFGYEGARYRERTKKNLHHKLRELRTADTAKLKWAKPLEPDTEETLMTKYAGPMADFITAWRAFQKWLGPGAAANAAPTKADLFYAGDLDTPAVNDVTGRRLYLNYLAAEHKVLPILDAKWDGWKQAKEREYINQQLGKTHQPVLPPYPSLVDTLRHSPDFQNTLRTALPILNEATLKARYQLYDSLQQGVKWAGRWRSWGTFSVLSGRAEQPLFNAANKAKTYADTYNDNYWQLLATLNGVWEMEKANVGLSGGVGTNNQLVFKKSNQQTYQTSRLQDSVLVVTQKSLYPTLPARVRYLTLQTQLTVTAAKGVPGLGVTAAYEALLGMGADAPTLHNLTLGIVVPVQAGSSTLLLIPQVRARSAEQPDRWSFGLTATASIPTFLKK